MARALVDGKLAACVNIFKNEVSVYEWQGVMCANQEYILHIKTHDGLYGQVEEAIKAIDPYDTPMILAWDITHIEPRYAAWVAAQTAA